MQMSLRSGIHGLGATKVCTMDTGPVPAVICLCKPGTTQISRSRNWSVKERSCVKGWGKDMLQYLFLQDTPPDLKQLSIFF